MLRLSLKKLTLGICSLATEVELGFISFSGLNRFATMGSLAEKPVSLKIRVSVDSGLAHWQLLC